MGLTKLEVELDYGQTTEVILDIDIDLNIDVSTYPSLKNNTLSVTKGKGGVTASGIRDAQQVELDRLLNAIRSRQWPESSATCFDVYGFVASPLINDSVNFQHSLVDVHDRTQIQNLHIHLFIQYQYLIQQGNLDARLFADALSYVKRLNERYLCNHSFDLQFESDFRLLSEDHQSRFNLDLCYGDIILSDPTLGFTLGENLDYYSLEEDDTFETNIATSMTYYDNAITLYCEDITYQHSQSLKEMKQPRQFSKWNINASDFNYGYLKIGRWHCDQSLINRKIAGITNYVVK